MPFLPEPESVPFDEIAAILDQATRRARGGPMAAVVVSGADLARALELAGCRVVRDQAVPAQLSL